MIANFEGLGELLRGVTNPIQEVKDARTERLEQIFLSTTESENSEVQRFSGDRGDTDMLNLGLGMAATFGTIGLGILAVDTLADGRFERIGYGSLAVGLLGVAMALREVRSELRRDKH